MKRKTIYVQYQLRNQTTEHNEKNVQSFQGTSSMQVHKNEDIASALYFQVSIQHKTFYSIHN